MFESSKGLDFSLLPRHDLDPSDLETLRRCVRGHDHPCLQRIQHTGDAGHPSMAEDWNAKLRDKSKQIAACSEYL